MTRVIFDIETVGVDFDSLEEEQQEYLLRYASTEEEVQKEKNKLGLYPLTGEIVAIGMLNPDTMRGRVFFQAPESSVDPFEEDGVVFEPGTEREILEKFWDAVKGFDQFITFNGRGFDCPFIIIRSAIHRVRPTRDLMPNRYSGVHIDLLDQLTFFGATRRFNLDMWCRAFGIESPKSEGISGENVKELFRQKRYIEIARYCLRDIIATAHLFRYWERYVKFIHEPE